MCGGLYRTRGLVGKEGKRRAAGKTVCRPVGMEKERIRLSIGFVC
jgi:hypothetical protein